MVEKSEIVIKVVTTTTSSSAILESTIVSAFLPLSYCRPFFEIARIGDDLHIFIEPASLRRSIRDSWLDLLLALESLLRRQL
jgi:hypothetical protein